MRLSNKLLGQGYVKESLKSSQGKFYGWYGDQYEVPSPECYTTFLRMAIYNGTLHWWDITPIFDPLLIWTLLPNLTFYLIVWGFHRTFDVCVMPTEDACSSGHLVLSHMGFANVILLRPLTLNHILNQFMTPFPDLSFRRIWRYYWIQVSIGHRQRMWHADRGRLLLRTPGPVPLWDLHMF